MLVQVQKLAEVKTAKGPIEALKFAAKLSSAVLGSSRDVIQRGWSARQNPDFYRSLGVDPAEAERLAHEAIDRLITG